MSVFEVIVLGVQGINNKVYGPGERVTEAHFPEGNAQKLEKEGKLKRISSKKEEADAAKLAKKQKLEKLQAEIEAAHVVFDEAQKAFDEITEEMTDETKEALKVARDNAQLALDIAKENFDKA